MYNDKFETQPKKSGKKAVAMLLVLVLLLGAAIGTTLAWLIDNTDPVVNTFTVGNINIELTETNATKNGSQYEQNFAVIPGQTVTKEADVIVKAGSEACWLFVEIIEAGDTNDWIDWEAASPWQKVDDEDNVYYIKQDKVTGDTAVTHDVLKDNQVIISGNMTKDWVDDLTTMPTITFKAYAIQSQHLKNAEGTEINDAADAWNLLKSKLS